MPAPHHSFWDRLTLIELPPRDFDRPLPLIGKLGRNIRKRRQGPGRALGRSFFLLNKVLRTSLGSPRMVVLLRRHWLAILVPLAYIVGLGGLAILLMKSASPYVMAAWMVYVFAASGYAALRRVEIEAWPCLAIRMRRQAVLRASPRFRLLHPEAGEDQSVEQVTFYLEQRRQFWLKRLNTYTFAERNALAYREHWWLGVLPFVIMIPMIANLNGMFRLGPLFPAYLLVFYGLMFGLPTLLARRRLSLLRKSLTDHTCPDCAYPLADFAVGAFRGQPVLGLGPRVCNECGVPWPLLPPPIGRNKPKHRSIFSGFRPSPSPRPEAEPRRSFPAGSHPPSP